LQRLQSIKMNAKTFAICICIFVSVQASWPLKGNDEDYNDNEEDPDYAVPRIPLVRRENAQKTWWNTNAKYQNGGNSWWWGVDDQGQKASSWWWSSSKDNAWWSVPTRDTFDVCRVSNNKVETVTGIRFSYPDTTCHTVLLRECASEPTFSVSLKRIHTNKDHWAMRILTSDNSIELKRLKDTDNKQVEIYLNDNHYKGKHILEVIENEVTVTRVVRQEEFTTVTLPLVGVQLAFDGFNVIMRIDKTKSTQFCGGICNHVDVEESVEPMERKTEREITELLHRKYISDKECEFA